MKQRLTVIMCILCGTLVFSTGCADRKTDTDKNGEGQQESDNSTDVNEPQQGTSEDGQPVEKSQDISVSSPGENPDEGATLKQVAGENEAEKQSSELILRMVGDILLHTPVEDAARREDGSYDFSALFCNTEDLISEADIALVNEEVMIGGESLGISGYPAFNAPYEVADALYDAGFDVTLQATNHALDKGKSGILNCLAYWDEAHPDMAVLGIHDSADDSNVISTFSINGIKIAVLNYTYGTNGIPLPEDMPYAVDLLDESQVTDDLAWAEENADFTVVCPHWGTEYNLSTDASQRKWAEIFVENGADLIIGTHPHVIEPIEWVTDESGEKSALVYYSLGNFVNWTSGTGDGVANRMVGGMADVTISRGDDGEVKITDYDVIALVTDLHDGMDGVTTYRLSDYTETQAADNEIISQDPEFSHDYCTELCDQVWGDLWK